MGYFQRQLGSSLGRFTPLPRPIVWPRAAGAAWRLDRQASVGSWRSERAARRALPGARPGRRGGAKQRNCWPCRITRQQVRAGPQSEPSSLVDAQNARPPVRTRAPARPNRRARTAARCGHPTRAGRQRRAAGGARPQRGLLAAPRAAGARRRGRACGAGRGRREGSAATGPGGACLCGRHAPRGRLLWGPTKALKLHLHRQRHRRALAGGACRISPSERRPC